MESRTKVENNLPAEISIWTRIRNFLFQDMVLELTPKQEKVFGEVYDFWHKEITGQSLQKILFYEITGEKIKKFLFRKIDIKDNIEL